MKKDQVGWIILIVGAAGLAWWVWSRQSGSGLVPGLVAPGATTPLLAGTSVQQGSGGQGTTVDSVAPMRGAYGEQARCNATGGRFIKTITKPAFGLCVDQATFAAWMASSQGSDTTTDQQVQAWLGAYQSRQGR